MKTIWKFPIPLPGDRDLEVPTGAKFLYAAQDRQRDYCVWFELDPKSKPEVRKLRILPTGGEVPADAFHHQTFMDDGFVWHIYELR